MENSPDSRRTLLVISIWAEMVPSKQLAWRGSIRTIDGQRMSFSTLTGLNRLLCELSGWHDSQMDSIEDLPSE
jgi:environmental stress-induced protein Ves